MSYSKRIKELREEKELRLYNIANIIGIEADAYGLYEREYVTIPMKHLNTICNYFNVSIDYIFELNKNKQYKNLNHNINLDLVGHRLKEFRKENKLTQEELANFLGIHKTTITKYETGKTLIATSYLYSICKKYKISADYLLGKIDSPKYLK